MDLPAAGAGLGFSFCACSTEGLSDDLVVDGKFLLLGQSSQWEENW